jgi:hypothetical protein
MLRDRIREIHARLHVGGDDHVADAAQDDTQQVTTIQFFMKGK